MRLCLIAVIAAAAGLGGLPALAQQPGTTEGPEIVVTGTRLNEMIREFVGEVTAEQSDEDQIARWDRRICPRIAGLPHRQAQFVADRFSQRAHQIGLMPGREGCQANVLVFVTPDADRFARELTSQFPEVFDPDVPNMHSQGQEALARFVESDAPVRWWHVSQTVSADGQIVRNAQAMPSRGGGFRGVEVVRTRITSRLERVTRQDFNRAIVIVDASKAAGFQLDALADYVAMATLAQISIDADTSSNDTILNLFSAGAAASTAMTTWDLAYLEGLYSARRNATNAERQESDIARRMRTSELDEEYLDEQASN